MHGHIMFDPIAHIELHALDKGVAMTDALADAGVAYSTWWRWKQGKSSPILETVRKIVDAIDARAA